MIETSTLSPDTLTAIMAELYAYTCTENGHYDWRIPTREEVNKFDGLNLEGLNPPWIWRQLDVEQWSKVVNSEYALYCLLVRDV